MINSSADTIIRENESRLKILFAPYDPITGEGSPFPRHTVKFSLDGEEIVWGIPIPMYDDTKEIIDALAKCGSIENLLGVYKITNTPGNAALFFKELNEIRFNYDYEFWAYTTNIITDKKSKQPMRFKLNKPQRKVLVEFEDMRLKGQGIRAIIDKARQWGGSTEVQSYMAWIQKIHRENWHSTIVTDVEDQARSVRGKYKDIAKNYPAMYGKMTFAPYQGSSKNSVIVERGCIVGIGSSQKPESLRTYDFAMCHLSEVAFFKSTLTKSAEDLVQALRASIPDVPYSLEVLESTAKGVGNFFHNEWLAAKSGESGYRPIFVAWFEIELYQLEIKKDIKEFIEWMQGNEYAMFLWNLGATLEGINWYFTFKKNKRYSDWRMHNEFPSTAEESFSASDKRVFSPMYVLNARKNNRAPEFIGELQPQPNMGKKCLVNIDFQNDPAGDLFVWQKPDTSINMSHRYVVSVDIGGRWEKADYSIIKVIDRYWMSEGGVPEVVATWRGHLDQDLIAWKAAQIAKWYNNALLVVESNSLDTDEENEGNHFATILDEIVDYYPNLYARTDPEKIKQGIPIKWGWQANKITKPEAIDTLNACLREESYIERDDRACDEMDTYEVKPNGTYGAVEGCKDDIVMATAIGLWACYKHMPKPEIIKRSVSGKKHRHSISEATI